MRHSNCNQIAVGRKGGIVQLYDADTFTQIKEWKNASRDSNDPLVSIEYHSDIIYSCSAEGVVHAYHIHDDRYGITFINDPVSAFRIHPKHTSIFAYGGMNRPLEVYQITSLLQNKKCSNIKYQKIFRARRTLSDETAKRHAVWISDLQFLNTSRPVARDGLRIAVTTRFGEILLYETTVSSRPIIQVLASFHPLIQLWFGGNEHELLFCDTQFNIGTFDSVTGESGPKLTGQPSSRILSMSAAYQGKLSDSSEPTFPVRRERVGQLRQVSPGYEEQMEQLSILESLNDHSRVPLFSELLSRANNLRGADSRHASTPVNEASAESAEPTSSPPIILAAGGLDSYLRIFDLSDETDTFKININSRISKVLILNSRPVEEEDIENVKEPEETEREKLKRKDESIDSSEGDNRGPKRRRVDTE